MIFNNRVKYSIMIYLVLVIILVLSKPKFFFKKNGQFKEFGTGPGKTVIPFWLVLLVCAIISYYLGNLLILIRI
tara:strand:- start:646 stop:867 length:222 start_codon:yes stop_codon:yes gene_type:complete